MQLYQDNAQEEQGKFPEYPSDEEGGSNLIFNPDAVIHDSDGETTKVMQTMLKIPKARNVQLGARREGEEGGEEGGRGGGGEGIQAWTLRFPHKPERGR